MILRGTYGKYFNFRKRILNDKYEERARMQNQYTQTDKNQVYAQVQTEKVTKIGDLHVIRIQMEDDQNSSHRKSYIYNAGE